MIREGACRGCGKTIKWATTKEGKWIPLDPQPPVFRMERDFDGTLIARLDRDAFVSHFSTCPKANQFSGLKK